MILQLLLMTSVQTLSIFFYIYMQVKNATKFHSLDVFRKKYWFWGGNDAVIRARDCGENSPRFEPRTLRLLFGQNLATCARCERIEEKERRSLRCKTCLHKCKQPKVDLSWRFFLEKTCEKYILDQKQNLLSSKIEFDCHAYTKSWSNGDLCAKEADLSLAKSSKKIDFQDSSVKSERNSSSQEIVWVRPARISLQWVHKTLLIWEPRCQDMGR